MNGHRSPRISMFTLCFVFVCIMLGAGSEMQISVEFGEVCAFRAWLKVPFSEMVKKNIASGKKSYLYFSVCGVFLLFYGCCIQGTALGSQGGQALCERNTQMVLKQSLSKR